VVAFLLQSAGLVETPLLVAIILCATSLGVIVPVLKDVGELTTTFGQLVLAAASIADFGGRDPAAAGRAWSSATTRRSPRRSRR
jgi:Kef-type K+ transport system membrane component KefB